MAEENLEPVTLTTIANRLLALLVKNNGILISRDFIFSTVWDDHKTASNSNLNNYIASLRRICRLGRERNSGYRAEAGFALPPPAFIPWRTI
ncbi:helix-turn-helix domain-containing protein [Serratia marcescens]|uniref:Helix-turn-helix domain-containing protein n=1 Tax=Serratia marcescens TaxID=615 RepID=A0A939SR01_SERMA|nr:helix-turn-helix domain-containing protein [Serratia marcescens]